MRDRGIPNCTIGLTGERLSAWRDQLLSPPEMTRITAHLPRCPACQQRLAQFDAMAHQLRGQPELEPGNRIWQQVRTRIMQSPPERYFPMKTRTVWSSVGAIVAALLIIFLFVQVLNNHRTTGPGSGATNTPPQTTTQFKVTSVDLAVNPTTVTGLTCGSTLTVTYTATFHIVASSPGGTIQFMYTSNNGRGSNNASVTVAAGQTTATYAYSKSGTLAADHTFPGIGEVITSSPNSVSSPQVSTTGTCTRPTFKVTSIGLTVNPTTVNGLACGSTITVTYTAAFHIVASSAGGTIQFMYTTNNGRGSTSASVTVAPDQTYVTYAFSKTGVLFPDHTFPGIGEVITSSPNSVSSPQVAPSGTCH